MKRSPHLVLLVLLILLGVPARSNAQVVLDKWETGIAPSAPPYGVGAFGYYYNNGLSPMILTDNAGIWPTWYTPSGTGGLGYETWIQMLDEGICGFSDCQNDVRDYYDPYTNFFILTTNPLYTGDPYEDDMFLAVFKPGVSGGGPFWYDMAAWGDLPCGGASGYSAYTEVDQPELAVNKNWIILLPRCYDSTGEFYQQYHIIDKAQAEQGKFVDYAAASPSNFVAGGGYRSGQALGTWTFPLMGKNNDSDAYAVRIVPSVSKPTKKFPYGQGRYQFVIEQIYPAGGLSTSPVLNTSWDTSAYYTNDGSTTEQICGECSGAPNAPQAGGKYQLGANQKGVSLNQGLVQSGDEDSWGRYGPPAGDSLLEFTWNMKYGVGNPTDQSFNDGGIWTQWFMYDLSEGMVTGGVTLAGDPEGTCEWSYPSIAHSLINGVDYVALQATYSATPAGTGVCGGSTSGYSPGPELFFYTFYDYFIGLDGYEGPYPSPTDVPFSAQNGYRWGDYSTVATDPSTSNFWFFNDYYDGGYNNVVVGAQP